MISEITNLVKRSSQNFRIVIISTFVIGMIAHGFCYTNMFPIHDGAGLYWDTSIYAGAPGSRWLAPVIDLWLNCVQMPWLDGIISLCLYGFATWYLCKTLGIKNRLFCIFISGLMITSPTAICSNIYLSSAPVYALALLMACLSVWAIENWKWGNVWSCIFLFVTCSLYASYINVTAALFIVCTIRKVIQGGGDSIKNILLKHIEMVLGAVIALVGDYVFCKYLTIKANSEFQNRVSIVTEKSDIGFVDKIYNAREKVFQFFSVNSEISFFQEIPSVFCLFMTFFLFSIIALIVLVYKKKIYKNYGRIVILLIDLYALPIALNILGIITDIHYLMTFSYIMPSILFIMVFEMFCNEIDVKSYLGRIEKYFFRIYEGVLLLFCVVTIVEGCKIANLSYTKQYNNYVSGLHITNRIVDHIESIEGYVPGETKLVFVGSLPRGNIGSVEKYSLVKDLTGAGNNTALTYNYPLIKYINQHLGIDMVILNSEADNGCSLQMCMDLLRESGVECSEIQKDNIESLDAFPQKDCFVWIEYNKVLVYKIGK